ncbi:hypothetical protein [Methylocystis sp. S23]|jgi:hypothetical protein
MKHLVCLIVALFAFAAQPAHAEPMKLTVKELREIKVGLQALMSGLETRIREGERDRVIREQYHFASAALDSAAAKDVVRVEAALKPVETELSAALRRICPSQDDCRIADKDDAATRDKKGAAIRQFDDEQDKAAASELTVDLIRLSEQNLDEVTPKLPIAIRAVLWPLTK